MSQSESILQTVTCEACDVQHQHCPMLLLAYITPTLQVSPVLRLLTGFKLVRTGQDWVQFGPVRTSLRTKNEPI
jgi:hypothetical protein